MRRLANNEEVRFIKTSDPKLDGQIGKVMGRFGSDPRADFYIVKLDSPVEGYDPAIVMIEHCLEKV